MSIASALTSWLLTGFQIFGFLAFLYVVGMQALQRAPAKYSNRIAARHLNKGLGILGNDVALVRTVDGKYTLAGASYDPDDSLLWVDYGEQKKGYDVGGMGNVSLPFLGVNLFLVYEDLGAAADLISAKVGREALSNYNDEVNSPTHDAMELPANGGETVADGGEMRELEEDEVVVPSAGVVADLRNVIHMAPFNVRPAAFTRVEKNAKASMQGFASWGPIAQTGGMIAAFFIGALIVWWVTGSGGGSGGATGGVSDSVGMSLAALVSLRGVRE